MKQLCYPHSPDLKKKKKKAAIQQKAMKQKTNLDKFKSNAKLPLWKITNAFL